MAGLKNPTIDPGGSLVNGGPSTYGAHVVGSGTSDSDISNQLLSDYLYQQSVAANGDRANQAYEQQLAWNQTLNQRAYDESWRDNEREYTSATSQLSRLMATGMSLDAALAQITNSGDAGSSSGVSQVQPVQPVQNRGLDIANSIFGGITSLFGLYSGIRQLGLSSKLINSQTEAQNIANLASRMQLDGLNEANDLNGYIADLHSASFLPKDVVSNDLTPVEDSTQSFDPSSFSSFDEMLDSFVKSNSRESKEWIASGGLHRLNSNKFARQYAEEMFMNRWKTNITKSEAEIAASNAQTAYFNSLAAELEPKVKQEQLNLLWQEVTKNYPDVVDAEMRANAQYSIFSDTSDLETDGLDVEQTLNSFSHKMGSSAAFSMFTSTDNPLQAPYLNSLIGQLMTMNFSTENTARIQAQFEAYCRLNMNQIGFKEHMLALRSTMMKKLSPEQVENNPLSGIKAFWDFYNFGAVMDRIEDFAVPIVTRGVVRGAHQVESSSPVE